MEGKKGSRCESGRIKTDGSGEIGVREKRSLAEIWKGKEERDGEKENRIALVYRSRFWTILFLIEKRKRSREGGIERKNDNIVTRDANLVGTLMDDDDEAGPPYFHELEEDTIAKLREKSFRTD